MAYLALYQAWLGVPKAQRSWWAAQHSVNRVRMERMDSMVIQLCRHVRAADTAGRERGGGRGGGARDRGAPEEAVDGGDDPLACVLRLQEAARAGRVSSSPKRSSLVDSETIFCADADLIRSAPRASPSTSVQTKVPCFS